MNELSDEELMVLYQDGNEAAFNRLYTRYESRVYGFLKSRLPPQALDDVFQLALLKFHRSRHQFNSTFTFAPWLFTIVRTTMIDWQKDHRNHLNHVELKEEFLSALSNQEPKANADRPDLSKLPELQRAAIELRYFDELSFEEIAKRLDTTPVNIRKVVSRGINTLKSLLTKAGG